MRPGSVSVIGGFLKVACTSGEFMAWKGWAIWISMVAMRWIIFRLFRWQGNESLAGE